MRCNAEFYYVGKTPTYWYWAPVAAARRGFKMVLLTASHGNTFVGSMRSTEYPTSLHCQFFATNLIMYHVSANAGIIDGISDGFIDVVC